MLNELSSSLRRGFASAREERLEEWTVVRQAGFWCYWSRRWARILCSIWIGAAVASLRTARPVLPQLLQGMFLFSMVALSFVLIELVIWRRAETKWSRWMAAGEDSHAGSNR
ncbi:hypothetical protein [Luteolibacter marinus]|uniref:hypothetical protein n=1 Tax=Luteolibacter marinus TaxID=2776705 RepID=UPI001D01C6ED|nr:hypothetical protein [Luteolibacter marinus]